MSANIASDTVTSINLKGPANPANIKQIAVGSQPEAIDISPDGKEVWVGQNGDGKISIIDPANDTVKEEISVGKVLIAGTARDLGAFFSDARRERISPSSVHDRQRAQGHPA